MMLGGVALAEVVFTSVTGCGGEREGSSGVTMTSESAETEGSQQTAEISTPRGTVRGLLYPVEHSRGAVLMVGGRGRRHHRACGHLRRAGCPLAVWRRRSP